MNDMTMQKHDVALYGGSGDGDVVATTPQLPDKIITVQTGEVYERDGNTKSGTPRFTLRGYRRHTEGGAE
jgi:hypothetical protein